MNFFSAGDQVDAGEGNQSQQAEQDTTQGERAEEERKEERGVFV